MKRLGLNIVTTYVARFANILAIFLLFAWVESAVGTEAYGVYLLTASLAALLSMDLGLAGATTRFIAIALEHKDDEQIQRITGASSLFFLGVGVIAFAATGAVVLIGWDGFEIPADLRQAAVLTTLLAATQAFAASAFSVNRHVLAGIGRLDAANFIQLGQAVVRVALTLVVLSLGEGIVAVAAVDLAVVLLAGLVSWLLRRRCIPTSRSSVLRLHPPTLKRLLGLSVDLLVMSVAGLVILQTGNLIVSLFLPIAAVTIFSAGFRLYQAAREVTNSLTSAMLPFASSQHAAGAHRANAGLYLTGTRLANLVVLAVCVPLIVFAPLVIETWLGPGFDEAAVVAQVLLLSLVVNTQHLVAVPILTAQGSIRSFAILHGTWATACLGLGVLLTPWLGVVGMALAIAIPVVVLEPVYLWVLVRRLAVPFRTYAGAVGRLAAIALFLAALLAWFARGAVPTIWTAAGASAVWLAALFALYWLFAASPSERGFAVTAARRLLGRG